MTRRKPLHTAGRLLLVLACAAPLAMSPGDPETTLSISQLSLERDRDGIYVTMEIEGAFGPKVREALRSGVPLSFEYLVRIRERRPMWFDRTVVSRTLEVRAKLDPLSGEYMLGRSLDGQSLDARTTRELEVAQAYLSRQERLRIEGPDLLVAGATYDVLAKAKVLDEFVLYVIPWAVGTPWERQTFLPTPTVP